MSLPFYARVFLLALYICKSAYYIVGGLNESKEFVCVCVNVKIYERLSSNLACPFVNSPRSKLQTERKK